LFNEYLIKAKKVEDLDPAIMGLDDKLILNFMMFVLKDLELISSSTRSPALHQPFHRRCQGAIGPRIEGLLQDIGEEGTRPPSPCHE
jgi:hypothetical protein